MNIQGMNHRDPSFGGLVEGLLEDLKYLYKTDSGTPFIFPATGTGAWESALVNCLSPGDKVVAFRKGASGAAAPPPPPPEPRTDWD